MMFAPIVIWRFSQLPMRRALIGQGHGAAGVKLAPGFSLHQHGDALLRKAEISLLLSYDIRQLFNCAGQMGDLFF